MLQKISGKGHLEVIQVRTPEELKRCDGLIIPGGGRLSLNPHIVRVDPPLQSHPPSHYLRVCPG